MTWVPRGRKKKVGKKNRDFFGKTIFPKKWFFKKCLQKIDFFRNFSKHTFFRKFSIFFREKIVFFKSKFWKSKFIHLELIFFDEIFLLERWGSKEPKTSAFFVVWYVCALWTRSVHTCYLPSEPRSTRYGRLSDQVWLCFMKPWTPQMYTESPLLLGRWHTDFIDCTTSFNVIPKRFWGIASPAVAVWFFNAPCNIAPH